MTPDPGLPELEDIAVLDLDRVRRRGFAEAVYGEAKSVEQLRRIAAALHDRPDRDHPTLFTRMDAARVKAVLVELPGAAHHPEAGVVAWPGEPPATAGERVVVVSAGTSDLPVAHEAAVTARYLGRSVELVADVGIAGLHRLNPHLGRLRSAGAIVVAAGMDGALPTVIGGLVSAPVVAVPTSVGYGASFQGLAALLTMLNACAPGVGVVNIDNGYGAGHLAAQIAAPRDR